MRRCAPTCRHSGCRLGEVEAVTRGDTPDNAHALVDTLADTLAEVEAVRLFHTQGDAMRCALTVQHSG